jgi:hypothetical protein
LHLQSPLLGLGLSCLLQVLARLGVRRLVVGHTPQASGRAAARCGGRLLLLDTGMSSGMLGSPAAAWVCHPGDSLQPLDDDAGGVGVSGGDESSGAAGSQRDAAAAAASGSSSSGRGSVRGLGGEARHDGGGYSVVAYADGTVAAV